MVKQVIVIRKDLHMRRGKEIAQGAHAAMAWLTSKMRNLQEMTEAEFAWVMGSFAKVVCVVDSEEELLAVHSEALASGLTSHLITDEGRTEFGGVPTHTAVGIGPDYSEKMDPVTGNLKLY